MSNRARKMRAAISCANFVEIKNIFDELLVALETAETDNEYYQAILNGTWPQGREILIDAIKKYNVDDEFDQHILNKRNLDNNQSLDQFFITNIHPLDE